jgi:hypothetical protein
MSFFQYDAWFGALRDESVQLEGVDSEKGFFWEGNVDMAFSSCGKYSV